MDELYPLQFQPIYRHYLWGGHRLRELLGKPVPEGQTVAESWEIVDRGPDQSVVVNGPLAGTTLGQLVQQRGPELLGRHHPQPRFPLLMKFLDAAQNLSVQVHPDDEMARTLDPPDWGKTEAWVVLHAELGSRIYAGLKRGFDRAALEREVLRGTTELCLHSFEPRVGDCVFLPAGTVHALGAGLVVAEIQQSSDVTFRLYDWNRVGPDGKPRPLHIEQALKAINYEAGPVEPRRPQPTGDPHVERLVECDKFVLDRWRFDQPKSLGGDQRFHIFVVLEGQVLVEAAQLGAPLQKGQTILIPAASRSVQLRPEPNCVALDIYLP